MSLNDVRKSPSFASILVGSLVFLGTGCSSPQVARIQSQKSAKEWKAGFVESAAGEMKVQYAVEGEYGVIGGDVLMPLKKIRETSKAKEGGLGLFMGGSLWPNARIPYSVSPDFCCNAELQQAMTLWSAAGVTFAPKQDSDVDYVYIVNEPPNPTRCGGSYGLGRMGGRQLLTTRVDQAACGSTLATMAHELGHALGFSHEHKRPDRDSYLIFPSSEASDRQNSIDQMGQMLGAFDVGSVMMYSSLQIPGMLDRMTGSPIGEVEKPSANDIQKAASAYGTTASGGGSQPSPSNPGNGGQAPAPSAPQGQSSFEFSYAAPVNACLTAVGINDGFPQLGISIDNIPYFACHDPSFTLGEPIIVCRSAIHASSCFYTKRILVNGQIKLESDVLNQGGSSASSGSASSGSASSGSASSGSASSGSAGSQYSSDVRSYLAPMNGCSSVFGVQDSFPRLAYDSSNQPVFVCKYGTYGPYPVMACYLNGASQSCFDTGLIANF